MHNLELRVGTDQSVVECSHYNGLMYTCCPAADAAATHSKTVAAKKPSAAARADMIAPATAVGHVVLVTTCLQLLKLLNATKQL